MMALAPPPPVATHHQDLDSFLADWASHRRSFGEAVQQHLAREEQLAARLLHELHASRPEAGRPPSPSGRAGEQQQAPPAAASAAPPTPPPRRHQLGAEPHAAPPPGQPAEWDASPDAAAGPGMLPVVPISEEEGASVHSCWRQTSNRSALSPPPEAPTRMTPRAATRSVIEHRHFDTAVSVVITANSIYVAYQSNYGMDYLGEAPPSDAVLEPMFLLVYLLEISAKLFVYGLGFFCNEDMGWNIFDFTLVGSSALEQLLTHAGLSVGSIAFARTLRLAKLAKILRILRAVRFLRELRVMMASIAGSAVSLFWSFVMLWMILFVFALFFMQYMVAQLAESSPGSPEDHRLWEQQRHYFRNVERTSLTLLQAAMGGMDWEVVLQLIEPLGLICIAGFVFYILFFNFAVMNILTGIFVEKAMKLCRPDWEEAMMEQRRNAHKEMEELKTIVQSMDLDNDGTLTLEEFIAMASDERISQCLSALGVDCKDAELFFRTLATVSGEETVTVEDFAKHAVRMKGFASSIDLHGLIFQTTMLQRNMDLFHMHQTEMMQKLAELVNGPDAEGIFETYRSGVEKNTSEVLYRSLTQHARVKARSVLAMATVRNAAAAPKKRRHDLQAMVHDSPILPGATAPVSDRPHSQLT